MSTTATYPQSTPGPRSGLLLAGAITPTVFIGVMLAALLSGRTAGSQAGSDLALAPLGWLMSLLFVATGASILAFAVAQFRALSPASRVGTVLLGITGIAVLLSGVFITDAPGARETMHGQVHNMLFMVTMVSLLVGFIFNGVKLRRNGYRWALAHSIAATVALPILVVIFGNVASDHRDPFNSVGGFVEFGIVAVGFGWIAINSARILRAGRTPA
ncbi:MAG: hypothetical protein NVSMB17_12090 [Candidatus Dormibacteria bacterium]